MNVERAVRLVITTNQTEHTFVFVVILRISCSCSYGTVAECFFFKGKRKERYKSHGSAATTTGALMVFFSPNW